MNNGCSLAPVCAGYQAVQQYGFSGLMVVAGVGLALILLAAAIQAWVSGK